MRLLKKCSKSLGFILGMICAAPVHAVISIGPSQAAGPLQFGSFPPATDWSTIGVGTGAGTYTDTNTLDAAVIANTVATNITAMLGSDGTQPPAQNAIARWNNAGFYLQTRPTGNDYQILMARLRNDTGADRSELIISYDWDQRNNIPVNESVAGHRVFWSLTGEANSWTLIPELSTFDNN